MNEILAKIASLSNEIGVKGKGKAIGSILWVGPCLGQ